MTMIKTVESAYQSLADEVIAFIEGREWESAGAHYGILSSSVSSEWWLISHGEKIEVGNAPPFNVSKKKSEAVHFLRENLLTTTGERIWSLTFILYPNGKFNIEYDYNKPEGFEESDDVITAEEINQSLNNISK